MNANSIHLGVDYAYTQFPSRGKTYYPFAKRVRVNFVYKAESTYSGKRKTLVECYLLDEDGNREINPRTNEPREAITVRAREIVATWSEHLVERERHQRAENERQERWRREDEERRQRLEREEAERKRNLELKQAKENAEKEVIYAALASLGIPRDVVTINSFEIRIARYGLEEIKPTTNSEPTFTRSTEASTT